MILKRFQLKEIYDQLQNPLKTQWALNSGYTGYQGLYRYLRENGAEVAFNRVIEGLEKTIGTNRLNAMVNGLTQSESLEELTVDGIDTNEFTNTVKKLQQNVVRILPYLDDIEELQAIEEILDNSKALIKNQRERLELLNKLNSDEFEILK